MKLNIVLSLLVCQSAFGAPTPQDKDVYFLAQKLKPISDETWESIAGNRLTERYEIIRGDNLWNISKRLFGDGFYWPKVWAINNGYITNPHYIQPGNSVAFLPGTGTSLPAVALESAPPPVPPAGEALTLDAVKNPAPTPPLNRLTEYTEVAENEAPSSTQNDGRSQEWRYLPKQTWEEFKSPLPPTVDPQGFDRRNKVVFRPSTGFEIPAFVESTPLESIGYIAHSTSRSLALTLGDTIFITGENELPLGRTFTIVSEPKEIPTGPGGRVGYSYLNLGKVKILKRKDQFDIGLITQALGEIKRGASVIALEQRARYYAARPARDPIDVKIYLDRSFSSFATSQHKIVYLDRGTNDGVEPGMIARVYQNTDPGTDQKIADQETVPKADIQVVRSSADWSTGLVLDSRQLIDEGDTGFMLTSVESVYDKTGNASFTQSESNTAEKPPLINEVIDDDEFFDDFEESGVEAIDDEIPLEGGEEKLSEEELVEGEGEDLDALAGDGELTEAEKKELQQLEDFEGSEQLEEEMLKAEPSKELDLEEDENFEELEDEFAEEPPTADTKKAPSGEDAFDDFDDDFDDAFDDGLGNALGDDIDSGFDEFEDYEDTDDEDLTSEPFFDEKRKSPL